MKTIVCNTKDIKRKWFIVDASDKVLGRMASKIATKLMGKDKVAYSPNQDHGDYIIVVNADKIKVTGRNKPSQMTYFRHSTYPGGDKIRSFETQMALDSRKVITLAVKRMLPKTSLGKNTLKKLHVYSSSEHPHMAQTPVPLTV
jgi:large subunit ribosomal protein L13